jgi:hypothetical protein
LNCRLEICQGQLEQLREKLDELRDSKRQLKEEQTGHSQVCSCDYTNDSFANDYFSDIHGFYDSPHPR